jgi:hypothetical protein
VIDDLEDALVLEPWGTDSWRFRHELLREVAAELAPPSVRRGLHAKLADALVHSVGGDPDWRLVAAHYEAAERFDEAASAYRQASTDARRRGALAEARSYLTLALAQLEHPVPGVSAERATARGLSGQGPSRPAAARRMAVLGVALAHSRVRRPGPHHPPLPRPDPPHPRPRAVQRPIRSHQHPPAGIDQARLRIPQPRRPHRHGPPHPRRPLPTSARPIMKLDPWKRQ